MASSKEQKNQVFIGTFIHSKKLDELEYLHDTAVCVDKSGKIAAVEPQCDIRKAEETLYRKLGWDAAEVNVTVGMDGEFFFPGFIGMYLSIHLSIPYTSILSIYISTCFLFFVFFLPAVAAADIFMVLCYVMLNP